MSTLWCIFQSYLTCVYRISFCQPSLFGYSYTRVHNFVWQITNSILRNHGSLKNCHCNFFGTHHIHWSQGPVSSPLVHPKCAKCITNKSRPVFLGFYLSNIYKLEVVQRQGLVVKINLVVIPTFKSLIWCCFLNVCVFFP